ncbi:MAG: phosphoserine phosphatase [Methanobrevibacter sp.]|uniref:phosphoserine phosphatase n=1 Tax=Methanobrevibacter sp. TaxID=66852 RepID=UPI003EFDBE70
MKFGKGKVKKYSREYNRTLKNGEKKKYTTKQIQITIPKNEDIYDNNEEVLIIPNSEIENFNDREEENEFLKVANYFYVKEVKQLNEKMNENLNSTSNYEEGIKQLKTELSSLKEAENKYVSLQKNNLNNLKEENENLKAKFASIKIENENLKIQCVSIKEENKNLKTECSKLKEDNLTIKNSYNQVSEKYDQLKQENFNTKTGYAEIYELNEKLEKDYDALRLEYNELVDKINSLEEELYKIKAKKTHDEHITNKVKEFILKRED